MRSPSAVFQTSSFHSGPICNLDTEVALAVVASREVVAKAGQLMIRVHQPDRELAADRDIHALADC